MNFILLTGRTWMQGAAMEGPGKRSSEYQTACAVCYFDPEDLKTLGVEDGNNIEITREGRSVVVTARLSEDAPHKGKVFVPLGPWANILVDADTGGTGMPMYKGLSVEISSTTAKPVLTVDDLLKAHLGGD